ncbi:MAG: LytTR family transcriptional regulator [Paramuribaculum sp.]|nr:LytTR family transcriptional regulator [Paramuribaculum sp.]
MEKRLVFNTTTEIVRIPFDAVVYIVAGGNYSTLYTIDAGEYVVTLQLGHVEDHLAECLSEADNRFIRIGKSLIVNRDFIVFIHPQRKKLVLSDCRTFHHELSASKDALKALKELIEKEDVK